MKDKGTEPKVLKSENQEEKMPDNPALYWFWPIIVSNMKSIPEDEKFSDLVGQMTTIGSNNRRFFQALLSFLFCFSESLPYVISVPSLGKASPYQMV